MTKKGRPPKKKSDTPTKTPTTTKQKEPIKAQGGFNVLEMGDKLVEQTKESLLDLRKNKKNIPTTLRSLKEIRNQMIPFTHFGKNILFSSYGYQPKTLMEVMGGEGLGKTTLLCNIFGEALLNNCPCLLVNTESKWLNEYRTKRALSSDKELSDKMYQALHVDEAFELRQLVHTIETWVDSMRHKNQTVVPGNIPLVIGVDTLSKVMSPGEALGFYNYSDYMSEANLKKAKELGDSSNLEFAKLMHLWSRRLPSWLSQNNVFLIFNSHQNQKVNMTSFGAGFNQESGAGLNKTKIGGNASNQNTLSQLILKYTGMVKNTSKEVIGKEIVARIVKNTNGADHKELKYILKTQHSTDTSNYQEPALDFDEGTATYIAEKGFFGTTVSKKRFSSDVLGVRNVTAKDFMVELHKRNDLLDQLGSNLEFTGYVRSPEVTVQSPEPDVQEQPETDPLDSDTDDMFENEEQNT